MRRVIAVLLTVLTLWACIGAFFGVGIALFMVPEQVKDAIAMIGMGFIVLTLVVVLSYFLYDQMDGSDIADWIERKLPRAETQK